MRARREGPSMIYVMPFVLAALAACVLAAVVTHSRTISLGVLVITLFQSIDFGMGPILYNDERRQFGVRERAMRYAAPLAALAAGLPTRSVLMGFAAWAVLFILPSFTAPRKR